METPTDVFALIFKPDYVQKKGQVLRPVPFLFILKAKTARPIAQPDGLKTHSSFFLSDIETIPQSKMRINKTFPQSPAEDLRSETAPPGFEPGPPPPLRKGSIRLSYGAVRGESKHNLNNSQYNYNKYKNNRLVEVSLYV